MPPVGFEPTTPAGERPQTYTLDRAATFPYLTDKNCNCVSLQPCMTNILEARKKMDLTIPVLLGFIINQCTKSRQRPTRFTD